MKNSTVCMGLSLYNEEKYLAPALGSLLKQTHENLKIYVFDNGSTDQTSEIVRDFATRDERIFFRRSSVNLGMIRGFRQAYEMTLAGSPEMKYYSWGSGHDLWHPEWLQTLVGEMEKNPQWVLAYPLTDYIDAEGMKVEKRIIHFETAGMEPSQKRFKYVCDRLVGAGNMAYGLYRSDALSSAGIYRRVLLPDRLLMIELSLRGQFGQVPQFLWFRRVGPLNKKKELGTVQRQKKTLFEAGKAPFHIGFPWWAVFGGVFFEQYFMKGVLKNRISKWDAVWMSFYLTTSQCFQETSKKTRLFIKRTLNALGLREFAREIRRSW